MQPKKRQPPKRRPLLPGQISFGPEFTIPPLTDDPFSDLHERDFDVGDWEDDSDSSSSDGVAVGDGGGGE